MTVESSVEQVSPIIEIESLMRQRNWLGAIEACQAEIDRHPTLPKAHGYLGMCLFRLERYPESAVSFQRAIALDPHFWEAGTKLAQCYTQMRQYEEAYKEVCIWLHHQPNDHTLQGLAEFLRPMVRGEHQKWERTMNHEVKIVMPNQ